MSRYRIGVDIGGTFTDFVMVDRETGRLFNEKVLTTPHDPSRAVIDGVGRLLRDHRIDPGDVAHVIHGTTLVANALIERRGVKTALVTTRGFRDVIEIGLEWRYDTYDLALELPAPLAPRERRFEVAERIGPDGRVLQALDEDSVAEVARALRAQDVQAVGVCLLHSFLNDAHERRVRDLLRQALPGVVVCISSDVVPEIGEYERMSTTLANAYVLPIFEKYLAAITRDLHAAGIRRDLYLMLSDGGTVHESTAIRHPIRLVQSGPAGGVQATTLIGQSADARDVFCFDMGGTTAKACLIDSGEPLRTTEFEVARVWRFKKGSGLPLRIPVIDMIEIGAGGGSIARVDRLGLLQIGPESSGADPGPACYGRGGQQPTVTDADLVLGYLGADSFLGGDMRLDSAQARASILRAVGEPLGLGLQAAAWGIHDSVNENMARAAAIHALERARRITDYTMVPIGGAGPVHAAHIAMKLGLARVVVPMGAGVASAFGFLASPMSFAFSRGRVEALAKIEFVAINRLLDGMEDEGRGLLAAASVATDTIESTVQAAMRYVGQGHEIDVTLSRAAVREGLGDAIAVAFAQAYQRHFGRVEAGTPIEIVSWRLNVRGPRPPIALARARPAAGASPRVESITGHRPAWCAQTGAYVHTPVHDRYRLEPGSVLSGPALLEERESTVVLPRGARARCDDSLNLVIDLPGGSLPVGA